MAAVTATRRLGFISAAGIALAVGLLVAVAAWSLVAGQGLFSSGPLNSISKGKSYGGVSSHLGLSRRCAACHTAPWESQTMADKCLACHSEVAAQVANKSGLHAGLVGSLKQPTCRGCHTEHNGTNAPLTVQDSSTFPHELTGYSLRGHWRTGQGRRFTCADCHGDDLAHFDQGRCAACHEQLDAAFMAQHEQAFGKTCLLCHNGSEADGRNFDHNKLPFKLVGKHAQVACEKCHLVNGPVRLPQNTPQDCYSCHAKDDKHAGKFGKQCGQCHTAAGWGNAQFDHRIFPVDHGTREQASTCTTCHPNGVGSYTCFGCHRHTPANVVGAHEGKSLAALTDCIRCHAGGQREGGGD